MSFRESNFSKEEEEEYKKFMGASTAGNQNKSEANIPSRPSQERDLTKVGAWEVNPELRRKQREQDPFQNVPRDRSEILKGMQKAIEEKKRQDELKGVRGWINKITGK